MYRSLLVAIDLKRTIGKNNRLPWRLPRDLRRFKTLTMGKPIIMGRRTYESIGKPLPGRQNIVLSQNEEAMFPGCDKAHSLKSALLLAKKSGEEEAFVIGGANVYQEFLQSADRLYITVVEGVFDGDTFFPVLTGNWCLLQHEYVLPDEKNLYPVHFLRLARKETHREKPLFNLEDFLATRKGL